MQVSQTDIWQILTTAVAFIIFFVLAKKLFWNSILAAIEERQARIQGDFAKIDSMQKQVNSLQADYQKRLADIEAEARQKMQDAVAQGRKIAEEIAAKARHDADAEIERVKQTMRLEMDKAREELRGEVVKMTLGATEKIIRQKLDDPTQRQQVSHFVEELSRK